MFDKVNPLRKTSIRTEPGPAIRVHSFSSRPRKGRTVIYEAHELSDAPAFAVKFFDKRHRQSPNRFNLLLKYDEKTPFVVADAPSIIRTGIQVMLNLLAKNPYLSFGFMGAALPGEDQANTKRFRIYQQIMYRHFSNNDFEHLMKAEKSLYLLINRDYATDSQKMADVLAAFKKSFPDDFPDF